MITQRRDKALRPLNENLAPILGQAQEIYEKVFLETDPNTVGWWWGNRTRRRSTIARWAAQEFVESQLSPQQCNLGLHHAILCHLSLYESDEPTPNNSTSARLHAAPSPTPSRRGDVGVVRSK